MQDQTFPEVMTIEEARRYLQIGRRQMYELVRSGAIPHRRIGRTIRIHKFVLDEFVKNPMFALNLPKQGMVPVLPQATNKKKGAKACNLTQ
ncbi:MAG: helix-turn-helix domain-containing protein [Bacillota bacterium]